MKKIILVILLVMVLPFHIHAAPITIEGAGLGQTIEWSFSLEGQPQPQTGFAGQILTSVGIAYCIDLTAFIHPRQTYEYTPLSLANNTDGYGFAAMLMDRFGASIGSNGRAAGLQAAIWEKIYGEAFDLPQTSEVYGYQQEYLAWVSGITTPTIPEGYFYLELGNNQDLLARVASVPEPGTMLLLGLGLLGLGITTRRKS